jgi:hypothetical protein
MSVIEVQPIMAQIFLLEPTTAGFSWHKGKHILLTGCITYVMIVIAFVTLLTILVYRFLNQMKNLRAQLTLPTYKLQIMLFKTLMVQLGIIVITILIPYVTLLIMFCTGYKYGSIYASLALFPMTIHTIGNTISMIYFIKPYRRFIMETLTRTFGNIQHNMIGIAT